jgi:hypothetical protein
MVKGALVNTATTLPDGSSEVNAMRAYWAAGDQLSSNPSLAPNQLIDPGTGAIDYNLASWSAGDFNPAADPLLASWSLASWSCQDCSSGSSSSSVNPSLASWSNLGWATYWG